MLTCKQVATIVASEEFARAGWWRRLSVRMHLMICRHCRLYVEQIRTLGEAARELVAGDPDDLGALEQQILDQIPDSGDRPPGS